MDWNALINACITGSVVGAVTGITNWFLNRHLLHKIEQFEDKLSKRQKEEEKQNV